MLVLRVEAVEGLVQGEADVLRQGLGEAGEGVVRREFGPRGEGAVAQ
jgi:hypothetical protein